MNLAIAATVFPVIALGELPDKTMFASLLLAARGRPGAVWVGAALAFAVHVTIAVSAGMAAVLLLPRRPLDAVVAALFLAGAVLAIREMRLGQREGRAGKRVPGPAEESGGPRDGSRDGSAGGPGGSGESAAAAPARHARSMAGASTARVVWIAFAVIFAAEWGDLTQVLTANMAARYHDPVAVGVAAVLALWAVAAVAVGAGRWLARTVNMTMLRAGTAVVLAGFAAYAGWAAAS